MKKFANQNNCRTFVSGMRKQGSLDGIILLVISFSVINYVVSRASACEGRRFFFYVTAGHIKKETFVFIEGASPPQTPPSRLRLRSMLLRLTIPGEDPRTPSVATLHGLRCTWNRYILFTERSPPGLLSPASAPKHAASSDNTGGRPPDSLRRLRLRNLTCPEIGLHWPVGPFAVPTEKKNPRKLTR